MQQRQASTHTIASYRDTFRLLLQFAQQRLRKAPSTLALEDIDAPLVVAFLDELEKTRGSRRRTRNLRLTAIHSFFRYVAFEAPAHAAQTQRVWPSSSSKGIPIRRRTSAMHWPTPMPPARAKPATRCDDRLAALDFPLLRSKAEWEAARCRRHCCRRRQDIAWAQHLVIFFPLWLGGMPALLKGFLEQVARPGFAFSGRAGQRLPQEAARPGARHGWWSRWACRRWSTAGTSARTA